MPFFYLDITSPAVIDCLGQFVHNNNLHFRVFTVYLPPLYALPHLSRQMGYGEYY